jgi:hypothetical protein
LQKFVIAIGGGARAASGRPARQAA